MDKETIALLPPDDRTDGRQVSKALVRLADGRMAIEDLSDDAEQPRRPVARFRRSNPIFDPLTREVIGYEMEQVVMQASS